MTLLARQLGGDEAREAEVEDLHLAVVGDEDVGRLDVAMDDARAVRVREAVAHRERDLELARQRHPLGRAHPLLEIAPLEKLHGEIRQAFFLAEVVNGDDVAVRQLRGGTGLAEEAIPHAPAARGTARR